MRFFGEWEAKAATDDSFPALSFQPNWENLINYTDTHSSCSNTNTNLNNS